MWLTSLLSGPNNTVLQMGWSLGRVRREKKKKKWERVSLHSSAEVPPSSHLDRTGVSPVVFAPLCLLEYLCESSIGTHSHCPSTKFVGEMKVRAESVQKTARQVSCVLENRTL